MSQKQYRFQPAFQYKDPNFEFSSGWNHTGDYFDNGDSVESVTEMTDEKFLELGFPVEAPSEIPDTQSSNQLPPPSVINNPFFHIVSRKYILSI